MDKPSKARTTEKPTPTSAPSVPQWTEWTRHLVIVLLIIGAVVGVTMLRSIFGVLILSLLIAFAMYRPARFLTRQGKVRYGVSVVFSYSVLLIVLFVLVAESTPALIDQGAALWQSVERGFENGQEALVNYQPEQGITEIFGARVDLNFIIQPIREFVLAEPSTTSPSDSIAIDVRTLLEQALSVGTTVTQVLASAVTSITGLLSTILLAMFVSFLILLDLPRTERTVVDWLPKSYYREYALLADKLDSVWSGFFRGQVLIGIIIGILTWLQLELMGISNAAVLAFITGLISLIPTIGGFIALVPLSIVPLFSGSTLYPDASGLSVALGVVGVNLIISQIIWNVVAPKIMGDALNLPLPVVILGVFVGAAIGGVLGAFLASPVIASIQVLMQYLLRKVLQQDPFPGETAPFKVGEGWLADVGEKRLRARQSRMVRRRKPTRTA
jgi:predicted PurR-regulated permease PerM